MNDMLWTAVLSAAAFEKTLRWLQIGATVLSNQGLSDLDHANARDRLRQCGSIRLTNTALQRGRRKVIIWDNIRVLCYGSEIMCHHRASPYHTPARRAAPAFAIN